MSSSSDLSSRTINNYSCNSDSDIKDIVIQHNNDPRFAKIIPTYDPLGRISSKTTTIEKNNSILGTLTNNYVFYNGSYLVSDAITKVAIGSSTTATELTNRKYYYDDNGNITEITTASGQIQNKYHYDEKGQLEREDNLVLNASYKWEYDDAGNITAKKTYAFTTGDLGIPTSTISYGYASGTDKLTSYNGQSITYDAIGNPLTYKGNTLTWKNGRELATYGNYSFDYDANGIRVRKANGTNITNYIVDGSTVLRQSWISGSNSYVADYIYSEAGTPLAFALSTNGGDYVYYFYETNIQGDVIAIYNSSWTKLAAFYYDAWGKLTEGVFNTTGYTSAVRQGSLFRYRGYIYDTETQLYYLQTRYYDPQVGRFINPDEYTSTGQGLLGNNMYIYCGNNPVNRIDESGRFWENLKKKYDEFIDYINKNFKNDDGTISLYDNNRTKFKQERGAFHEQLFAFDPYSASYDLIEEKISASGKYSLFTVGWEMEGVFDLSLFDFGNVYYATEGSSTSSGAMVGASVWSPSLELQLGDGKLCISGHIIGQVWGYSISSTKKGISFGPFTVTYEIEL